MSIYMGIVVLFTNGAGLACAGVLEWMFGEGGVDEYAVICAHQSVSHFEAVREHVYWIARSVVLLSI